MRRDELQARSEDLCARLASPDFYPERPESVVVRETHISWVFLAGANAYKLKKPLVLPFLDYGTPERRHAMCAAEVRLNRRTAPDIYLGVRSVARRSDGSLELAAAEDPDAVDYVVEMGRYDEARTMAARLERGELDHLDVDATARELARFHAHAPVLKERGPPGGDLAARVGENLRELLAIVEQGAEAARVHALERFAHAFLRAHAGMLAERERGGFIRDVHGDLRAEHVLLDGEPRLLDCIEFDDALRQIDVGEDLSFLLMDLTARGGAPYADALLHAYRRYGGDPGDSRLIAFHVCNRALVRAKVELTRAAQTSHLTSSGARHRARASELLCVAELACWQARSPIAIVLCGLPGAGKSFLAERIARASGFTVVSSDATRKALAAIPLHERAPDELYSEEWNERTYAELGRLAAARLAASGGGVLVDATFRCRVERETFTRSFGKSAPLMFVECQAPLSLRRERAAARDAHAAGGSDASAELVGSDYFEFEPLRDVPAESQITVSTDRAVQAQLEDLRAWLDGRM